MFLSSRWHSSLPSLTAKPVLILGKTIMAASLSIAIINPAISAEISPKSDNQPPTVVLSSIKPIQLLVQTIAGDLTKQGVIKNQLLLPAGASPHDYAMRFSETKKLKQADAIFWIGENLETFLAKPLALAQKGVIVGFSHAINPVDTSHTHKNSAHLTHKEHVNHAHQEPHPWLSPIYAVKMASVISITLTDLRPEYAQVFSENLHRFTQKMVKLELSYRKSFSLINQNKSKKGFIVFHDAYRELVDHFKLNQLAVITPMAGRNPKLRHVLKLRKLIEQGEVSCIITEPNANTKILSKLTTASTKKDPLPAISVDPIAYKIPLSNTAFFDFFKSVLSSFNQCLK